MEKFDEKYIFGEEIGRGGFGVVYYGTIKETGEKVAIKESRDASYRGGMPREVEILQAANGVPGVVRLLDWYETSDMYGPQYIMVMSTFPDGCCDLFDYLSTNVLSFDKARLLMGKIVTIVYNLYKLNIIHGDIKDENVIIDKNTDEPMLIDFGAASFLKPGGYTDNRGTLQFNPPEWFVYCRYHGGPSTVWSLGILFYALINGGHVPFSAESEIVNKEANFPSWWQKDTVQLIKDMLIKDPANRITLEDLMKCI